MGWVLNHRTQLHVQYHTLKQAPLSPVHKLPIIYKVLPLQWPLPLYVTVLLEGARNSHQVQQTLIVTQDN